METIEEIDRLYSETLIASLNGCVAFYPLKGKYILNIAISSTMGPGIKLDQNSFDK